MAPREDCTYEIFDSSVFVEAIADTSGKKSQAKSAIHSVKEAENRIPVTHQIIIGEVDDVLRSEESFDDEISKEMARDEFMDLIEGFKFVDLDVAKFIRELEYLKENKGRIISEFNDSIIVAISLSSQLDKIHTTDNWNLNERSIKVNLI